MKRKPVVGFEGAYSIAVSGEVYSEPRTVARAGGTLRVRGRAMRTILSKNGYMTVMLSIAGRCTRCCVHRLIAEAWIPRCGADLTEVNHKNGIKTDNRVENLEWVTQSENTLHAYAHGLRLALRKLSDDQVAQVRLRLSAGESQRRIADAFGVCQQQISAIGLGKIYRRPQPARAEQSGATK